MKDCYVMKKRWNKRDSVWFLMKNGAIWKTQYKIKHNAEMGSGLWQNQNG
jgi:hypothetical protein